jgi:hypothetical protein
MINGSVRCAQAPKVVAAETRPFGHIPVVWGWLSAKIAHLYLTNRIYGVRGITHTLSPSKNQTLAYLFGRGSNLRLDKFFFFFFFFSGKKNSLGGRSNRGYLYGFFLTRKDDDRSKVTAFNSLLSAFRMQTIYQIASKFTYLHHDL